MLSAGIEHLLDLAGMSIGWFKQTREGCVKGDALESPKPTSAYFTRELGWQDKENLGAFSGAAFCLDLAAMRLDYVPGDR
jgi:hypothetical protein